jgi:DNA-binding MarR family transcriptional regulator
MKSASKNSCGGVLLEERLFVSILKSADSLGQIVDQFLKSHGLTAAQYNVLRILRGAEPEGLLCRGISDRMISRDPDMTRLLDRMEKRDLITRERQKDDRRVIKTRITATGLSLLRKMDQPIREVHKEQFSHLTAPRMKTLVESLEELIRRNSVLQAEASSKKV